MRIKKLFCVVDPTVETQPALDRAHYIAAGTAASVHAYVCCEPPAGADVADVEARKAEAARVREWLERKVEPLRADGDVVTTEVECERDWRGALAPAAARSGADLVLKSTYAHSTLHRRFLNTSDYQLLRHSRMPVLLTKISTGNGIDRVLAAVDFQAPDDAHRKLTDRVLEFSRTIAEMAEAELHCVNAYSGSLNRINPVELAERAGVDRTRAHVGDERPETLIREIAERIGAPLVVIGSVARSGLSGAVVGNTAEKILDTVAADILTVFNGD